ncbi:MAG: sulfite exporter TauE/SafE family protein [Candidatus Aenigmarchaeota archaeon]|nr:sulfite exporter TauE/SafE family protein [Candidatus Aenigmarchaeota archaeon]
MAEITIFVAFIAGILSFLSPCILPLVPAFIAYISGVSADQIKSGAYNRSEIFTNSIFFVLGFSVIFSILGVIVNTIFSGIAYDFRIWLGRIGGTVIILFGLYILGVLKLPFLDRERKFSVKKTGYRHLTSFLFGAAFAAGWTPCIGVILGAVLTLAITQPVNSFYLLAAYSLGLGMPFLLAGLFTAQAAEFINRSGRFMKYFNLVAGIFLVVIGVLVFTGNLAQVANLALPAETLARG